VSKLLMTILSLLTEPNPGARCFSVAACCVLSPPHVCHGLADDPCGSAEIGRLLKSDKALHDARAREFTAQHAMQ
jgi:hypothetical protein